MRPDNQFQTITTLDQDELQAYRTLRRSAEHFGQGIFVAEGEKVVRRLLLSHIEVISLLMTPEWQSEYSSPGHPPIPDTAKIFIAEKSLLEGIVGYNLHQGIMAMGRVPPAPSLAQWLSTNTKSFLFVALDGLVNAENVGIIVRNCAAFGVDAVISGETSSSPYLRRAVRNSMGAVFGMQVVHSGNLAHDLTSLREQHKANIIAAHPDQSSSAIRDCKLSGNVCIVLGNEGDGISGGVLEVCTQRVVIPMSNGTDSLNVANASAVFLYEASRQRSLRG